MLWWKKGKKSKPHCFFDRNICKVLGIRPKQPPKYRILIMMASNTTDSDVDKLTTITSYISTLINTNSDGCKPRTWADIINEH